MTGRLRTILALAAVLVAGAALGADQAVSRTAPSLTISTTAVALPASLIHPSAGDVLYCLGRHEGGQIRYWTVGAAPTASEGLILNPGEAIKIAGSDLPNWKAIRTGSTDGALVLQCYR